MTDMDITVEALATLVEAIVTTPLVEVEDETTVTLCVPLAAIKPAYWAACAAIGHQPTDPGPYCARCGATLTAVVQSAEHHLGDCAAVEEAGSSPARAAALPARSAGSGSRVEVECICGEPTMAAAHDAAPQPWPTHRPTPPPAVDGSRCGWTGPVCGEPESDLRHVYHPDMEMGRYSHPFTPPAPEPDRLRALEAALRFLSTYEKDPPEVLYDEWAYNRLLAFVHEVAARALLADGERSE